MYSKTIPAGAGTATSPAPAPGPGSAPAPATTPAAASAGAGTRYRVMKKTIVRVGSAMDSDKAEPSVLAAGVEFDALELQGTRVKFSGGWVSLTTATGAAVLEAIAADGLIDPANAAPALAPTTPAPAPAPAHRKKWAPPPAPEPEPAPAPSPAKKKWAPPKPSAASGPASPAGLGAMLARGQSAPAARISAPAGLGAMLGGGPPKKLSGGGPAGLGGLIGARGAGPPGLGAMLGGGGGGPPKRKPTAGTAEASAGPSPCPPARLPPYLLAHLPTCPIAFVLVLPRNTPPFILPSTTSS